LELLLLLGCSARMRINESVEVVAKGAKSVHAECAMFYAEHAVKPVAVI
jgi:hypothetical protein